MRLSPRKELMKKCKKEKTITKMRLEVWSLILENLRLNLLFNMKKSLNVNEMKALKKKRNNNN